MILLLSIIKKFIDFTIFQFFNQHLIFTNIINRSFFLIHFIQYSLQLNIFLFLILYIIYQIILILQIIEFLFHFLYKKILLKLDNFINIHLIHKTTQLRDLFLFFILPINITTSNLYFLINILANLLVIFFKIGLKVMILTFFSLQRL